MLSAGWLGLACQPRSTIAGVRKRTPATRPDEPLHKRSWVLAPGLLLRLRRPDNVLSGPPARSLDPAPIPGTIPLGMNRVPAHALPCPAPIREIAPMPRLRVLLAVLGLLPL